MKKNILPLFCSCFICKYDFVSFGLISWDLKDKLNDNIIIVIY